MNRKYQRKAPPKKTSVIGRSLELTKNGGTTVVVEDFTPGDKKAVSRLSQKVATYAYRGFPGIVWQFESFAAVTSQGRPVVGVILSRRALDEPLPPQR